MTCDNHDNRDIDLSPLEQMTWEYRSVFDGYRESGEFHDWTDLATAEDEAEAFRGLGCKNVRIERRRKHYGDANAGEFMAWAAIQNEAERRRRTSTPTVGG